MNIPVISISVCNSFESTSTVFKTSRIFLGTIFSKRSSNVNDELFISDNLSSSPIFKFESVNDGDGKGNEFGIVTVKFSSSSSSSSSPSSSSLVSTEFIVQFNILLGYSSNNLTIAV
jgi:hypothetical protein